MRLTIAAFAALLALPALAEDDFYPFDIKTRHPEALKAWQAIVPAAYRGTPWIYSFQGVAGPVEISEGDNVTYLVGTVCKPHDCGDNQVVFVIAQDGSRAVGDLMLAAAPAGRFGQPDALEASLLDAAKAR